MNQIIIYIKPTTSDSDSKCKKCITYALHMQLMNKVKVMIRYLNLYSAGAVLEGNIWFIAVLIGVGITFILIIIFCFVQHSKTGKYPGKFELMSFKMLY